YVENDLEFAFEDSRNDDGVEDAECGEYDDVERYQIGTRWRLAAVKYSLAAGRLTSEEVTRVHGIENGIVSKSDNLFLDHMHGEDENAEDVQMADHLRPMEELLRVPIEGIEHAIVVPVVLANEFELKIELLDFIRAAETWLENEPPNSITTWDDLVSKFLNRFYPHSKTRQIRNEITTFNKFSMRLLPKLGKDSRVY
ncbi:reverse transcriptase domain-containing protein, partial [Tanacetum coccineum]